MIKNYFLEERKSKKMEFLNEKLLSEGLFSASLQEISYLSALEQLQKMTKHLKDALEKTTTCKPIKIYDEKKIYPNVFAISAKDYRMTIQQYLSEPFSIFELERESGLTQNIIIKELNSVFDEINYAYKDMSHTSIKVQNTQDTYRFYAYLDFKKCLKNIMDYKNPKVQLPAKDMIHEFNEEKENIITAIKKHYLGKTLKFDRSYNSEIFKYGAKSGSGICYCLQDQNNGFIDKDFDYLEPKLSSWSATANIRYYLEETKLANSNLSIAIFPNKNGSLSLWLVSKPNIKITY